MYRLPWKINLYIEAVEWSLRDSECTTDPDAHSVQLYGLSVQGAGCPDLSSGGVDLKLRASRSDCQQTVLNPSKGTCGRKIYC